MRFENQTLTGDVTLDHNEFVDIVFRNCRFLFHGGEFSIVGKCTFENVQFGFFDAADRTLTYLRLINTMTNGPAIIAELLAQKTVVHEVRVN